MSAFALDDQSVSYGFSPCARVFTFHNGKGGVGKTSTTVNIGAAIAALGAKVLMVDLDPNGSMCRDYGYERDPGQTMLDALMKATPFQVARSVRPNLDVVKGGHAMKNFLTSYMTATFTDPNGPRIHERLWAALAPVLADGGYDFVFIDTPPNEEHLTIAAMALSQGVVIPTKSDEGSKDAVKEAAHRFVTAAKMNPQLKLVGAILFDIKAGARRAERALRTDMESIVDGAAPVFARRVREAKNAGDECRAYGLTAAELDQAMKQERDERILALREGKKAAPSRFKNTNAALLAEDYDVLTKEFLSRVREIEQSVEVA